MRSGVGEVPRADIVDRVRLLGRRAAEERRAMDDRIDVTDSDVERARVEQVTLHEIDVRS